MKFVIAFVLAVLLIATAYFTPRFADVFRLVRPSHPRRETFRQRILMALSGSLLLGLVACGGQTVSAIQTVLSDAKAIIALNILPANIVQYASPLIIGLEALVGSYTSSVAAGATNEATTLTLLSTSITQLQSNVDPTSTVYKDAGTALSLIEVAQTNQTTNYQTQIETDVGTLLLDYLAANQPASATVGGAPSEFGLLLSDARAHLNK